MENEKISRLHEALIFLLDEVDRLCRANNIRYFLDSGTALGAIRHGGFIPWDDDADVGMLRDDYDRFIRVAKEQLGSQFFLQTYETDEGYLKFNAKIRLNGTFFPERLNTGKNLHQGIFIDIFPFDFTSDKQDVAVKETKSIRRIYKLWMLRNNSSVNDNALRRIVRKCSKIIPQKWIRAEYTGICSKYQRTNTLTCYSYKMNDDHFLYFKSSDLSDVIDVDFAGRKYMLMSGYDNYLRTMFGDYMSLPPVEKRVSHLEGDIYFGE